MGQKKRLAQLKREQKIAFGASCCSRMIKNYEKFEKETGWGNSKKLKKILNEIWEYSTGNRTKMSEDLNEAILGCEELAPDADEFVNLYVSSAQEAVLGVCSLLDYVVDGDDDNILKISQFAIDSADFFAQEYGRMDPCDPLLEEKIESHPVMKEEKKQQREDMAWLEKGKEIEMLRKKKHID